MVYGIYSVIGFVSILDSIINGLFKTELWLGLCCAGGNQGAYLIGLT